MATEEEYRDGWIDLYEITSLLTRMAQRTCFGLYSPECVEGKFCERRLCRVLGSSHGPGPIALANHLCPQDLLGLPSSRHAQPHNSPSAFDRDPELKEGAAQALVGNELRHGQQHRSVRGVPEGVAVFQLYNLLHVRAQLSV